MIYTTKHCDTGTEYPTFPICCGGEAVSPKSIPFRKVKTIPGYIKYQYSLCYLREAEIVGCVFPLQCRRQEGITARAPGGCAVPSAGWDSSLFVTASAAQKGEPWGAQEITKV